MTPTPGGFPAESRMENAGQLRLTSHAIDALESDPAALVASFLGSDEFNQPPVCGGDDPYVCCTEGGDQPLPPPCGPIRLDLVRQGGDSPRLVISPVDGQSRVNVTARARISTVNPLPIEYTGANCDIDVVTDGNGDLDEVTIQFDLDLVQDPVAGTTRVEVLSTDFTGLETDDVSISGGVACFLADVFLKGYVVDQVTGVVEGLVGDLLVDQLCNPCPGGSVDE